jgi:hypothetical protein
LARNCIASRLTTRRKPRSVSSAPAAVQRGGAHFRGRQPLSARDDQKRFPRRHRRNPGGGKDDD